MWLNKVYFIYKLFLIKYFIDYWTIVVRLLYIGEQEYEIL